MPFAPPHWQPTKIGRFIEGRATSTRVMRVETDAGEGFLKALGNPEGPHVLASEWVGTSLADLFGLPTLDYNLIKVEPGVELPMMDAGIALVGPAFITRVDAGLSWGGSASELEVVTNREGMAALVTFDTWIRNRDRYSQVGHQIRRNPDNVWLSRRDLVGKRARLTAIDHTHCFTDGVHLTTRLSDIATVQDERVFGLFPEFRGYLERSEIETACRRLDNVMESEIAPILEAIPDEWEVKQSVRHAWLQFLVRRARYVSQTLIAKLFP